MGKSLKCKDIGVKDCAWEGEAGTEEELLELVKANAPVHGITEVPPEMPVQVKAAIKDE